MENKQVSASVALVGAGPGDPELLTLKALRWLENADVVVYDALVSDEVMALIPPSAEQIYVGKQASRHSLPQEEINALLVTLAQRGLKVVRLKGGDPFIFGRGGEEMQALAAAGIACDIVPGITAAAAAGAGARIPLTHRDHAQALTLVTGHLKTDEQELDWLALARPGQTRVFYMGIGNLPVIVRQLLAHGLPATTPAAVVENASRPEQRSIFATVETLEREVQAAGIHAPALIMIGSVTSVGAAMQALLPLQSGK